MRYCIIHLQKNPQIPGVAIYGEIITIFMVLTLLSGIPHLIEGIYAKGLTGVNYGIVGFPILIGVWSFYKYRKAE